MHRRERMNIKIIPAATAVFIPERDLIVSEESVYFLFISEKSFCINQLEPRIPISSAIRVDVLNSFAKTSTASDSVLKANIEQR